MTYRSRHFLASQFILLFLIGISALHAQPAPQIIDVTPKLVKMRHAETLSVEVSNSSPSTRINIAPGGPFVKARFTLPGVAANIKTNNQTIVTTDSQSLYVFAADDLTQIRQTIKTDYPVTSFDFSEASLLVATRQGVFQYTSGKDGTFLKQSNRLLDQLIRQISQKHQNVCLVSEDNQLYTLQQQGNIISEQVKSDIVALAAHDQYCITASADQRITLWSVSDGKLKAIASYQLHDKIHALVIHENMLYIANGNTGLVIFSLQNDRIDWHGSYNKLGRILNLTYSNDHVAVSDNKGVVTLFDVTQRDVPLLISDINLHHAADGLALIDKQLFATQKNQLIQIDFDALSPPNISTLGVNQGGSRRSFIKDDVLYVADWFSGLHLYDISEPGKISLLANYHTPGSSKGVLVDDQYIAYVADDDHGLQILDVHDKTAPTLLGSLPLSGLAYTMKLRNKTLFLASHYGGVHIIDVNDPSHPALISTYDTPGKAWAVALKGDYLYVADDNSGILVFDVKNLAKPELRFQYNPGGQAEDILIVGDLAYVAFFDLGLQILNIAEPADIKLIGSLTVGGNARGLEIHDQLLYLASWEAGVHVVDISNTATPRILSHYDTDGAAWGLSVKNKWIYVMDWWGGIKVLDARDQSKLQLTDLYHAADKIFDLQFHENFIYTAYGRRGLQVYDARNSLNPVWAAGLDLAGISRSLDVQQNRLVVATSSQGVALVDIQNPFQVKLLDHLQLPVNIDQVLLFENYVFAAESAGDLFLIGIEDSGKMKLVSRLSAAINDMQKAQKGVILLDQQKGFQRFSVNNSTPALARLGHERPHVGNRFVMNERQLYVIEKNALAVYDASSPVNPQSILNFDETLLALHVDNNRLYVTSALNKLYVLNITQPAATDIEASYLSSHPIERISTSNSGIFFSGDIRIASATLLPPIEIQRTDLGFNVAILADMPLGTYNFELRDQGELRQISLNAFTVGFPKFKSRFTMDDLKKKMQQMQLPANPKQ